MSSSYTHPANLDRAALERECDVVTGRRGGPGGQHRNKVETAVIFTHRPSGVSAEANERRSQAENRRVALGRLRLRLAVEVRSPEVAGEPSQLWIERCVRNGAKVSDKHEDFASLLAEALDGLASVDFELSKASELLGVSGAQILKLLRKHPPALKYANTRRAALGLHSWR